MFEGLNLLVKEMPVIKDTVIMVHIHVRQIQ